MNSKEFSGIINTELKSQKKSNKEQERRAAKAARQAARLEKKRAPFKRLVARQIELMTTLQSFTENGHTWSAERNGKRRYMKSIPVVLGDAPETEITPNHVQIALVSIESPNGTSEKKAHLHVQWGTFIFGAIAKGEMENVAISSEHNTNNNPSGWHTNGSSNGALPRRVTPENGWQAPIDIVAGVIEDTYRVNTIHDYEVNRVGYRNFVQRYRDQKRYAADQTGFEQNLEWVMTAAANPELNPHLVGIQGVGALAIEQSSTS